MAKLVRFIEGVKERDYTIVEGIFRIGRDIGNDILLDDDTVSGHHCEIAVIHSQFIVDSSDFWLRDLGSTNGTIVNGQRVNRHLLQHDDQIVIGPFTFRFLDPAQRGRARTTRVARKDTVSAPKETDQ